MRFPGIGHDNSGDLEEQLRENLKLRRALLAKVTEARDRNAKNRLSWALYWTFIALAGMWIFLWRWMLHGGLFGLQSAGLELWRYSSEIQLATLLF